MLGISQKRDDVTRCRFCGEKLSLLQRLSRAEYCNTQHRDAEHRDQEKLALGRLQQVVAEGREAEVFSRLGRAAVPGAPEQGGEWPEEANPVEETVAGPQKPAIPVFANVATVMAPKPSSPANPQEEESDRRHTAMPLCGPIYGSEAAAKGSQQPAAPPQNTLEMSLGPGRIPETPVVIPPLRVPRAEGVRLEFKVPSQPGERRGREIEQRDEAVSRDAMRFPALSIQSVDWSDAIERERQSWEGIPPLAGLIQIAGPQTLRFEARPRTPMPLPEHPAGNPVRAYKPALARGAGVPSLAGAIRGLGTWRTRFGSEGNLSPQWETDLLEASIAPDWKPRYPVFYTTRPWEGDGLEQIFGLGPGTGIVSELEESELPEPRAVNGPLAIATNGGVGDGAGAGSGGGSGTGQGSSVLGGTLSRTSGGTGAGSGSVSGGGSGMGSGSGSGAGLRAGAGSGTGAGAGPGSGARGFHGGRQTTGYGEAGVFGSGNAEEHGGTVSVEAVAALVKAARQSDRTRTPLRDIEVKLMQTPAAPRLAAGGSWRGLHEGQAKGLPERGPNWTKALYEVPPAVMADQRRDPAAVATAPAAAIPVAPADPAGLVSAFPALGLAAKEGWNEEWLQSVVGQVGIRPASESECDPPPLICIPVHRAPQPRTRGAAELQSAARLPEPWVVIQESANVLARVQLEPSVRIPDVPRKPARRAHGPAQAPRSLELGSLEKPGANWVLLRGSDEAATFRLALDHLRLAGPQARAAEWGLVGSHDTAAEGATGLPLSRGFVHRDLILQRTVAEPGLEPLICQFGSARGGQWDSRT